MLLISECYDNNPFSVSWHAIVFLVRVYHTMQLVTLHKLYSQNLDHLLLIKVKPSKLNRRNYAIIAIAANKNYYESQFILANENIHRQLSMQFYICSRY